MSSLVIFASGEGSGFQNFIDHQKSLNTQIQLLVTNNKNSQALKRAEEHNIETYIIDIKDPHGDENLSLKLKQLNPSLLLLCGFLHKVGPCVVKLFPKKIVNIHPSLLPRYAGKGFYGIKVFQEVIKNKDPVTGVTVHFVNEEYDKGQIIKQAEISVLSQDTPESLRDRLRPLEHKLYLQVVKKLLE